VIIRLNWIKLRWLACSFLARLVRDDVLKKEWIRHSTTLFKHIKPLPLRLAKWSLILLSFKRIIIPWSFFKEPVGQEEWVFTRLKFGRKLLTFLSRLTMGLKINCFCWSEGFPVGDESKCIWPQWKSRYWDNFSVKGRGVALWQTRANGFLLDCIGPQRATNSVLVSPMTRGISSLIHLDLMASNNYACGFDPFV